MSSRVLNLIALAGSGAGERVGVPGADLSVQAISVAVALTPTTAEVALLLAGRLLVDYPSGDFRLLEVGSSLLLEAGTRLTLTPVAGTATVTFALAR